MAAAKLALRQPLAGRFGAIVLQRNNVTVSGQGTQAVVFVHDFGCGPAHVAVVFVDHSVGATIGVLAAELTHSFCRTVPVIAWHFARVTFWSDHRAD